MADLVNTVNNSLHFEFTIHIDLLFGQEFLSISILNNLKLN